MRILYISSATFPSEKSHSLSIMRVCQSFHDAGHDVTLVGLVNNRVLADGDPVEYFGLRGGFSFIGLKINKFFKIRIFRAVLFDGFLLAWKIRKIIKEVRPDIIYSRLTVGELALVPSETPLIYEMHSLGPLGKHFIQKWVFLLLASIKNMRRIIVTTDYLMNKLQERFPKIQIVCARLSADLPAALDENDLLRFRRQELMGSEFRYHVGYTGYLDTVGLRGTDIIIKSAKKLPNVAFHIVGGESNVVEYWKSYARAHNQNNNVFLYGHRNPSQMPFFLNCFDIVLAPLQYRINRRAPVGLNMSPLKLPQYLSYGKAIVASDIPAHRECLTTNKTALLVPHDNVGEWVLAIKVLLRDHKKRKKLEDNAALTYRESFTHEMRVRTILSGFEDVAIK